MPSKNISVVLSSKSWNGVIAPNDEYVPVNVPHVLGDLANVDTAGASNGQVLTFISSNNEWVASTLGNLIGDTIDGGSF